MKMKKTIFMAVLFTAFNANAWISELPLTQDITNSNSSTYINDYKHFLEDKDSELTSEEIFKNMVSYAVDEKDFVLSKWFETMYKDHPNHQDSLEFKHAFYTVLYDHLESEVVDNESSKAFKLIKKYTLSEDKVRALGAEVALLKIKMGGVTCKQ